MRNPPVRPSAVAALDPAARLLLIAAALPLLGAALSTRLGLGEHLLHLPVRRPRIGLAGEYLLFQAV
jgi:hypothetical protein